MSSTLNLLTAVFAFLATYGVWEFAMGAFFGSHLEKIKHNKKSE